MLNDKVLYPLSESQKSIWYLEKAYPGSSINIVAGNLRLKGKICYSALKKALNLFVKRNDAMRLRIYEEDGVAAQAVDQYEEFEVEHLDFSKSGGLKELFLWDEEKTRTPFNIIDNPLFYCATYKVSDEEGGFYIKMHHLISDAWTMGLVARQVIEFYSKIRRNEAVDESPGPSFIEHLTSEAEYEKSPRFEKDKAYWSRKFETLPEMTVLKPLKAGLNSIAAKRKTLITPLKLSNKIREFCADNHVSVFTLFMSALSIYINRVTGIEDIVLGTTILNRTSYKEKETAGMFVSVAAPVRISIDDSMDFKTFAKAMLKENTDVLRHQKYPYNYLIRDLKKAKKSLSRLFDIVLNYQNTRFHKDETEEEYTAKWIFSESQVESLIISVNDREDSGNLIIDYDFLTDVFNIKEIEFIHQHIISLLWHALDNPLKKISKLEMISEKEKHAILHEFNNTYADYPRDKTVHQMFEEQAEKTPDSTALIFNEKTMTYAELNEKSNRLAHALREKGVGPDRIVAIMTYRSFEMIIGILGILKAGGAYMPIDPDYPARRKSYMLNNSGASILLAQSGLSASVDFDGLVIDLNDESVYSPDASNLPKINTPRDLAYVIYTSGSTGNPKGVMVEHSGVVNRINWMQKKYPLDENSVIMQKTTYTFDVSVWELFWWSFAGASVCLLPPGGEKDPEVMIKHIEKHKVTTMHFVPSMLTAFLYYVENRKCSSRLVSVKNVFVSGEMLTINQVHVFNRLLYSSNGTLLSNLYGPTEATVDVSYFDCSPMPRMSAVPIGKPIDNISLYIFDKNRNLLPVGIPGELYIGGAGVARGYLYNPDLTSEKFVVNPYKHNEILYRTGDRARWYPKGDIEFLGRMDDQVKIRGFRIELGEIEARLLSHEKIRQAVVKSFSDKDGQAYLAAFIVTSDACIGADNIRKFLSQTLPDYMVPAQYVFLDSMPLNSNGKADRNALYEPENTTLESDKNVPPANETEAALAEIWGGVLGLGKIGMLDEYTALGGDSLNAIKIITQVHKAFGVEMSPRDVFTLQTVRGLARRIEAMATNKSDYIAIPQIPNKEYYEVSSAQKRLFILNRINNGISYNLPGGLVITGDIDITAIQTVFSTITRRHESLRTSFEMRDGRPVQIVHDDIDITVDYLESETTDYNLLMADFVKPFDLNKAPLCRCRLVGLPGRKHLLMFDMHHIISDGASVNIIISEIMDLLMKKSPPELTIQYRDYAEWHNSLVHSENMKSHEDYWVGKFQGEIPVLTLPADFPRPVIQSFNGDKLHFTINEALTADIKSLTARTGTTLYMLLLAAYNVLLSKSSGQEDIIVGTPVEGRRHDDLRQLVGMFVNTLALRSRPEGAKGFDAYLREIKEEVLDAFDHQEYPFEELVEKIDVKRDTSRNALFDTMFILQNMDLKAFNAGGISAAPYSFNNKTAKFDLTLEATAKGGTIDCVFEYCTDIFTEDTIKRLSSHYVNILIGITANPESRICDIDMLSDDERRQLLYEFNGPDADYPREKTIHQIFEEQAERSPENIALIFNDKKMTYRQLNERANQLARTLREYRVGPDTVVGLMVNRSFEMIIAILGTLKAGGAYMPIDPMYPAARKKYMIENSGASVILAQHELEDTDDYHCTVIRLDDEASYSGEKNNLPNMSDPGDLAYIIYTSGSTGNPKGTMITHTAVINRIHWMQKTYPLSEKNVILQKTTYTFDVSVWELFWWFFAGASSCLLIPGGEKDPEAIIDAIFTNRVTTIHFVPSMLGPFLDYVEVKNCSSKLLTLTSVFASGEALTRHQVDLFNKLLYDSNGTRLTNLYGPTEATVDVSYFDCSPMPERRSVPIGRPIDNIKLFILDRFENLTPVGVPGELYIGGVGVGKGYVNNPPLTAERFLPNRYMTGEKYYKTGDLARWNKYGEIEFLGRIDFQIKIRGRRIELGEIENRIIQYNNILEAVVISKEDEDGLSQLNAYFVAKQPIGADELRAYLSKHLPEYMVPRYIMSLDRLPYSTNGKIDRKKLPDMKGGISETSYVAPVTEVQKKIAEVWSDVLEVQKIGLYDNFFDLGGNSLNAIRVMTKIDYDVSITDLYRFPTLYDFAEQALKGAGAGRSLLIRLSKNNNEVQTNIICFPYGGGNVYSYKQLSDSLENLSSNVTIYAVSLPGHDARIDDDFQSIETVCSELVKAITESIKGEIILYSHCVGSSLLVETARLLEKEHVKIKAAYIGGIFPPMLVGIYGWFYKPWSRKTDEKIKSFLRNIGMPEEVFENEQYTKMMIRAFRHDSQGFTDYFYRHRKQEQKLKAPVYCIVGNADATTRFYRFRYRFWLKYAHRVELVVLQNANHYFINTHANEIARYMMA